MRICFFLLLFLLSGIFSVSPALAQEDIDIPYYEEITPDLTAEPPPSSSAEPEVDIKSNQSPLEFYRGGMRMGTSSCDTPETKFECGFIVSDPRSIIAIANQCIRASFGTEEEIMGKWSNEGGALENCILPNKPSPNALGQNEWAVCCVQKIPGAEPPQDASLAAPEPTPDICFLACTRYMQQMK